MGTELMSVCIKEENDEVPSIPPGFESFASFTLKRVQDPEKHDSDIKSSCSASASASESISVKMETEGSVADVEKVVKSLRHRPWINYGQFDPSSEDESDSGKLDQNFTARPGLPKGVTRGCPTCRDCQKVTGRWRPEDSRRPDLEDAPVFYPTEEEFEDTLKYIASIRMKAEPYGICRIVPPSSWKPPCPLKEKRICDYSTFVTRVQRVDKLQNRHSMRKVSRIHTNSRRKRRRSTRRAVDCGIDSGNVSASGDVGCYKDEIFGFEPGPTFTLNSFQKYADFFKAQYFGKDQNDNKDVGANTTVHVGNWEPPTENIEGEYWRIVEKATEEIEVLYGADLETGVFGSGFPKKLNQVHSASDERYIRSGWNLNNFPRLPGSVLSYESGDISGVLVPWLYIGMCFSSFCWHVEDHHLYSLNYMHWGAPKMWYGVPGKDALHLEDSMRKHLPDLFEEQPDLLHKLVTQLSPSILKSDGVPVYRCVQNAGEFVLTFPRAYHSGFNCGFNCAEAVNVAPVDWLPHGQIAIELYREQGRKTSISHDKLLLGAAREAVKAQWELNLLKKNTSDNLRWKEFCGNDGILTKALKKRVDMECSRRESLYSSSQALKMESNFDAISERECCVCLFDLHLSAVGCNCSSDKYACLLHAKHLCSCAWDGKFFLYRYDTIELNILVEALEGKLSAVYRWARLDLGLALSSYISGEKMHFDKLSHSLDVAVMQSQPSDIPVNSAGIPGATSFQLKSNPAEALLGGRDIKTSTTLQAIEMKYPDLKLKTEQHAHQPSSLKFSGVLFSQKDRSYGINRAEEKCSLKKASDLANDSIILLSDDEGDEPKNATSERATYNSLKHSECSSRHGHSEDKANQRNRGNSPTVYTPKMEAATTSLKDLGCSSNVQSNCSSYSMQLKDQQHPDGGIVLGLPNFSRHVSSTSKRSGGVASTSSNSKETSAHKIAHVESNHQQLPPLDTGKSHNADNLEKVGTASSNWTGDVRASAGISACPQNNLDKYFRQKGPRIAKVVRRINCCVEPLEFGVVLSGKLWCTSRTIFPKGYKSRVKYISALDPTSMCYYISEILDAGREGPLFMVSLEHCPNEVFIHVSAAKCWEMVRERVNQEITKQHKLGRLNLPPLQPPGSLDGFEMFGFSTPAIVQAIEAMDRNRLCTEYWDSRPYSRPQIQIPLPSQLDNRASLHVLSKDPSKQVLLPGSDDSILKGLFKRATQAELQVLCSIVNNDRLTDDRSSVNRLLNEEIHTRPG